MTTRPGSSESGLTSADRERIGGLLRRRHWVSHAIGVLLEEQRVLPTEEALMAEYGVTREEIESCNWDRDQRSWQKPGQTTLVKIETVDTPTYGLTLTPGDRDVG